MALPSLPPQPLLTDVLEAPRGLTVARKIHRVWSQWFNAVINRVQMAPMILTTSYQKDVTAAITNTVLLPASSNTQEGLYRITYHNDLNTAGGKCQLIVSYTCDGSVRNIAGVEVSSVTDPTSGVMMIDPDIATDVTYSTTCVIPGPGIDYNLSVTLERMT